MSKSIKWSPFRKVRSDSDDYIAICHSLWGTFSSFYQILKRSLQNVFIDYRILKTWAFDTTCSAFKSTHTLYSVHRMGRVRRWRSNEREIRGNKPWAIIKNHLGAKVMTLVGKTNTLVLTLSWTLKPFWAFVRIPIPIGCN